MGHSKGGVDAAAALSMYWPELRDKVAGLALAQSPYGGSPIASDIMREGQLGDYFNVRKLMEILICKVIKVRTLFYFLSISLSCMFFLFVCHHKWHVDVTNGQVGQWVWVKNLR